MTAEGSSRADVGVALREHVKVTDPRVPARWTLDVGQDDLSGSGWWTASLGRRGSAAHRRAEGGAERCSRRGGRGGVGDEQGDGSSGCRRGQQE
jgi:hypothetical protein